MEANDYQKLAARTINPNLDRDGNLNNAALGLSGEAGEVADQIKKYLFHGHALEIDEILYELGDALWYIAQFTTTLNVSLSTIMALNINKLERRFPNGFNSNDSINRVE